MLEPAFELWGNTVSRLELLAFALALACIVQQVRERHWAWPLAFLASLLYVWLFAASKLYGEAAVNLFFAGAALWGWWQWLFGRRRHETGPLRVAALTRGGRLIAAAAWLALWAAIAWLLAQATDSDVPLADAFVTAGSVVGTVLLGRKFIENWWVWLVVNAASVALFLYKALWLTAILYAIFFALAIWGLVRWRGQLAHA
ncbi:MAG: nicotinamide riboside transporter PnuC [Casimicrobiaceae bacterium]|nr:nicotinamide riboside transporter PnuC [Casimicrobiaceae bacterium]MDW8311974.1 nicotinamide riboside transporter PnuC [Burkholderiales bacterium]